MIEIICIAAVIFLIGVFFYKRSQEEIQILQVEAGNIDKLAKLLLELEPVVAHGFKEPPVWKREETLKGRLGKIVLARSRLDNELSLKLAEESGLRVWMEHSIFPKLVGGIPIEGISWSECFAMIGGTGLSKTIAYTTVVLPTTGALTVTLLTHKNGEYLPPLWEGRDPNTFTVKDGPLVGNLIMVDVIVRPGSFLCVPSHWYMSIKAEEPDSYWCKMEVHHPISWLQEKIGR